MAELRLILACLFAVGCGSADAQPAASSGIQPPAGWQPLPAAATAARMAATASGGTVDGAEAWGEPAMGCYAVWISLHGGSSGADALTQQILDGLAAEKITATQPADGTFAIEKAPYKGTLETQVGDGKITALACMANQREPASCEAPCKALLGALR